MKNGFHHYAFFRGAAIESWNNTFGFIPDWAESGVAPAGGIKLLSIVFFVVYPMQNHGFW